MTERLPRTMGQDTGRLCTGHTAQPEVEVTCPVREQRGPGVRLSVSEKLCTVPLTR